MLCVTLVAKTGNIVSSLVFLIPLPRSDCFCQHLFVCVSVYLHKTPVCFFTSLSSTLRPISSSPNHHHIASPTPSFHSSFCSGAQTKAVSGRSVPRVSSPGGMLATWQRCSAPASRRLRSLTCSLSFPLPPHRSRRPRSHAAAEACLVLSPLLRRRKELSFPGKQCP